jgi:transketolase
MAVAERHLATRFNRPRYPIVDHYTYAIVSDGDMMVGISHEVASLAGHLKLGKLIALYDSNRISIDGSTDLTMTEDVAQRFVSYGWHVQTIDGHNRPEIDEALQHAKEEQGRPSLIVCNTHIGFGSPSKQDSASSHGAPLGEDEVRLTKRALGWPEEPAFYVPDDVYTHMRCAISRGARHQQEWEELMQSYRQAFPEQARLWDQMWNRELPEDWDEVLPQFEPTEKGMATRVASGKAINALSSELPGLISGSADLHNSNMTLIDDSGSMQDATFADRNIFYGVREHGMGSMINGMILHGGVIPYGGTFLIFSDYMRPSLRMAALMGLPAVYVFSHDSIGVGEDGPTHQPIEQVPSLRLIPNLHVVRPADANEAAQAWRMALEYTNGPTALVLTRQALPVLTPREDHPKYGTLAPASGARRGGYVLRSPENPDIILMASGSEVHLALDAALALEAEGIAARVVSMPCMELFDKQDQAYRDSVLPPSVTARVSVEAAMPSGWERYVGLRGMSVGISTFGASAPFKTMFEKYGMVPAAVVEAAHTVLQRPA